MPDLATTDARFGFVPWESVRKAQLYSVVTANSTAFFVGDLVRIGDALLTPHKGYLPQVTQYTSGVAGSGIGAVIGCFDHHMKPLFYIPSSTTGNSTIAGYVMVSDDPDQLYLVQEDGASGSLTVAAVGLNVDAVATHAGATGTGLSGMEIASSTLATTNSLAVKVVAPHPEDTVGSGGTSRYGRWIVKLNAAMYAENIVGAT